MKLTKLQTRKINRFVKKLSAINSCAERDTYLYLFNIRDNKLWYNNEIIMCELNTELLLKFSNWNWFNNINNYFGKVKIEEFEKRLYNLWVSRMERKEFERAEKLALIIEQETDHNKRVELIKELLER